MPFYAIYPPAPIPVGGATAANQVIEIGLLTSIDSNTLPPGQATMANSSPVVIASDQSAIAVTGPLTDAQLRATPVPVSGTVSTGGLTDAQLRATPVPVSGTVTANAGTGTFAISAASLPLPTGAATEATLLAFSDKTAAGFVPEMFDETVITYVGATTDISTVTYKLATATVALLTMSYDGSNRLTGVVKT